MNIMVNIPGIGEISEKSGFAALEYSSDGLFKVGGNCVASIISTSDRKVGFIAFKNKTLDYVRSEMGYPAYYLGPFRQIGEAG